MHIILLFFKSRQCTVDFFCKVFMQFVGFFSKSVVSVEMNLCRYCILELFIYKILPLSSLSFLQNSAFLIYFPSIV